MLRHFVDMLDGIVAWNRDRSANRTARHDELPENGWWKAESGFCVPVRNFIIKSKTKFLIR